MWQSMGHSVCQPTVQVMRLCRAALKIPAKSSVPPRSPLYKLRPLPTPSESTLPQVLIPLHFNSFRSNTYRKNGEGSLRPASKFANSSLPPRHSSARAAVLIHFDLRPRGATDRALAHPQVLSLPLLDVSPQISENTATLSPFAATLTGRVKPKSCVCDSYKKHRGGGGSSAPPRPSPTAPQLPQLVIPRESRDLLFYSGLSDHGPRIKAHEPLGSSARLCDLCASALSFSVFRCHAPRRFPICSTHWPTTQRAIPPPSTFNFRLSTLSIHHSLFPTHSQLTAPPCSRTDNDSPRP
jgi:hypothetical protein